MEIKKLGEILTNSEEIKSVSEYLDAVNSVVSNYFENDPVSAVKTKSQYVHNHTIWFRGHAKKEYENLPAIMRPETWKHSEYDYQMELNLFNSFKRRSKIKGNSDFEYLHLMQHYGLPTRLLDFTESSLIGLFFAVCKPDEADYPHVWIFDPFNINDVFHAEKFVPFMHEAKENQTLWEYIYPKYNCEANMPVEPMAVYPSFYDDRVVAQKSVFVLFGNSKAPLEQLKTSHPLRKNANLLSAKLNIDKNSCHKIFDELCLAGIDYYTVFPDLEGLTQQLKNEFSLKGSVIN